MAKITGTVVIERDRCKGCRVCVEACPMRVLDLAAEVNAKGYNYARMVDPDACTGCASCALVCPDCCITVYRQKIREFDL